MKDINQNVEDTTFDWRVHVIGLVATFLGLFMPKTLVKRLLCIVLLCAEVSMETNIRLSGYSERSIYTIKAKIREGRYDELLVIEGGGRKAKLADLEKSIVEKLETGNYHTHREIADMIETEFGIENVSVSSVRRFLKNHEYKKLKSGSLPAKADVEKQRNFYESVLKPLIEKAKDVKNNVVLLYMDASHFVVGCDFLGAIYCKRRRFTTTLHGRSRYNVLGAIDYRTKQVLTVTNDTSIRAAEICQMLNLIRETYPDKEIHIVLDNASYQKCKAVTGLAEKLNIDLEYIPPYSPNLNLIERFWRHVKSELRKKYYKNFTEFKNRIDEIISLTVTKYYDKVCGLIGEKVQLFDEMERIDDHTLAIVAKTAA